jgi:nucleoid DNA-binding protein
MSKLLIDDLLRRYQKLYNTQRPKGTKKLIRPLARIHLKLIFRALFLILSELKDGDSIGIFEFGVFKISRSRRSPHQYRNPITNKPIMVKPRLRIKFDPSKHLLQKLKEN